MSLFVIGFRAGKKAGSRGARLAIRRKLYKELRLVNRTFNEHYSESGDCSPACPEGSALRTRMQVLQDAIKIAGGRLRN